MANVLVYIVYGHVLHTPSYVWLVILGAVSVCPVLERRYVPLNELVWEVGYVIA